MSEKILLKQRILCKLLYFRKFCSEKKMVKSGHRIELFIITNIHRKNDHKENSFVNLLLASLTKLPRMILELPVKKITAFTWSLSLI